ncbi:hypothetical protein [Cupriavidus sp. BIS7]|uniref:hypothetical protein n=1 Tax=Cupriavidus sp. BIS7 TaxID=1217718 RepID=UPI0002EC5E9A|nr:hypothetical protein [Cupriavidus sp. BIS7]
MTNVAFIILAAVSTAGLYFVSRKLGWSKAEAVMHGSLVVGLLLMAFKVVLMAILATLGADGAVLTLQAEARDVLSGALAALVLMPLSRV